MHKRSVKLQFISYSHNSYTPYTREIALGALSRFICHFRLSHYQITIALSTVRTLIIESMQL